MNSQQFSFEGVEKVLEIVFRKTDSSDSVPTMDYSSENSFDGSDNALYGLCSIHRSHWQEVLDIVQCQILDVIENQYCIGYLLSESSLFVFPDRIILKTCGTTTLLLALRKLIQMAEACSFSAVDYLFYSHKGYMFPENQEYPHRTWDDEVGFIKSILKDDFSYKSVIADKVDDWSIIICQSKKCSGFIAGHDITIEIQMSNIDANITNQFWKSENCTLLYKSNGISEIYPKAIINDYIFDPCGYSLNGLVGQYYFTIHITPQNHCSYISFETSVPVSEIDSSQEYSLKELIQKNLKVFKPGSFSISIVSAQEISSDLDFTGFFMQDKVYEQGKWKVLFYSFNAMN